MMDADLQGWFFLVGSLIWLRLSYGALGWGWASIQCVAGCSFTSQFRAGFNPPAWSIFILGGWCLKGIIMALRSELSLHKKQQETVL